MNTTVMAPDEIRAAIARALAHPLTWKEPMPPQGGPELADSPPSQAQQASQDATLVALHRCWRRGDSTRTAAAACGVSQSTATRRYRKFKADTDEAARPLVSRASA
ncbi:hypothetical protein ACFYS8_13360 [Kitasatospora sp. NPDC004615]|uniref:hypothetical protein n=1 Tax=Kitasatospora sp. NPDC004615 TaxID=3364017 RepID=UPI0036941429